MFLEYLNQDNIMGRILESMLVEATQEAAKSLAEVSTWAVVEMSTRVEVEVEYRW